MNGTLMNVWSITNSPGGQASCAQQLSLSLSRCIDRSVGTARWVHPLHFSRKRGGRAARANARAREHMHFDESVVDHEQTCGAGKLCATTLSISLYRSLGVYTPSFLKALADACKLIVLS